MASPKSVWPSDLATADRVADSAWKTVSTYMQTNTSPLGYRPPHVNTHHARTPFKPHLRFWNRLILVLYVETIRGGEELSVQRELIRRRRNHKCLTRAAEPATRGVDMEVPHLAESRQLWLSLPSLDADSTFSVKTKHDTQAGKQVGKKDVSDEASCTKMACSLEVGKN